MSTANQIKNLIDRNTVASYDGDVWDIRMSDVIPAVDIPFGALSNPRELWNYIASVTDAIGQSFVQGGFGPEIPLVSKVMRFFDTDDGGVKLELAFRGRGLAPRISAAGTVTNRKSHLDDQGNPIFTTRDGQVQTHQVNRFDPLFGFTVEQYFTGANESPALGKWPHPFVLIDRFHRVLNLAQLPSLYDPDVPSTQVGEEFLFTAIELVDWNGQKWVDPQDIDNQEYRYTLRFHAERDKKTRWRPRVTHEEYTERNVGTAKEPRLVPTGLRPMVAPIVDPPDNEQTKEIEVYDLRDWSILPFWELL